MNHSFSSEALQTERYFDQESMFNQRKVKVYIRTVSRKSIKIELPAEISLNQLKEIIRKKFHITHQNQVLYLKGVCLNFNAEIMLQNDWIIHVINLAEVKLPEVIVNVKSTNFNKSGLNSSKHNVFPQTTIKQFIQENILEQYFVNLSEILLVESGRILKFNLNFLEQNIQTGTTINLINAKKDHTLKSGTQYPQDLLNKSKDNATQISDKKSQAQSIQQSSRSQLSMLKISKSPKQRSFKIHEDKQIHSKECTYYVGKNSFESLSKNREPNQSLNAKNISIQIGQRECNCKKPVIIKKQPKFITTEDKKRLSKQIREQNLQKLMIQKQKKEEQINENSNTERRTLAKVKSMEVLTSGFMTERKKSSKMLTNPEKPFKF